MALVINTNIASLNAQNNLNKSQGQLDQALAQLSSGLRINSPADNPAGYAIAQRMTSQINGFTQAQQNANDGISFAQVANGALNTITNSLQQIRTLAIQSANSTNSAQDRQALNSEVQQAIAQVNATAQTTQFNGQSILNGSLSTLQFQVGANQNQIIQVNGLDARGQNLGAAYTDGTSVLNGDLSGLGQLTIQGTNAGGTTSSASVNLSNVTTTAGAIANINNVSNVTGVYAQKQTSTTGILALGTAAPTAGTYGTSTTASGNTGGATVAVGGTGNGTNYDSYTLTFGASGAYTLKDTTTNTSTSGTWTSGAITLATGQTLTPSAQPVSGATYTLTNTAPAATKTTTAQTLTVNGVQISIANGSTLSQVASAVNSYKAQTGVSASVVSASGNELKLSNSTGADITVSSDAASSTIKAVGSGATVASNVASAGGTAITGSGATFSAGIELYTQIGGSVAVSDAGGTTGTAAALGLAQGANGAGTSLGSAKNLTLNSTNVSTQQDAQTAIKAMDFALTQMSQFGGILGALQSRFQATISNLQSASQNTQAARSRIQDTNFAAATAQLSRAQILQQAGVAMVAQANSQPQLALSLLK